MVTLYYPEPVIDDVFTPHSKHILHGGHDRIHAGASFHTGYGLEKSSEESVTRAGKRVIAHFLG